MASSEHNLPVNSLHPGKTFTLNPDELGMRGHMVLIRVEMGEKILPSGIIMPEQTRKRETPMFGTVVRTGNGGRLQAGGHCSMTVEPGEKVVFTRYGGHDLFADDGTEYRIVEQFNVWAKVVDGEIHPHGNRVLVKVSEEDKTLDWGFIIPDSTEDQRDLCRAEVIRCGPGTIDDKTGVLHPLEVEPGDQVLMTRYAGMGIEEDGKKYLLVSGVMELKAVIE